VTRNPTARVLVDSSVWIDFYRPSPSDELRTAVAQALIRESVFTMPLIVAEVVQGAPDEESLEAVVEDFSALHQVELGMAVGATAARIGFALRRRGQPAPAGDLLIAAAALCADCRLWHRDAHFEAISEVAPVAAVRM